MASKSKIVEDFTHGGRRVVLEEYPNGYLSAWLIPKGAAATTSNRLPVSTGPRSKDRARVKKAARAFLDKSAKQAKADAPRERTVAASARKKHTPSKKHKDVEFEVSPVHGSNRRNFNTFDEASSAAIALSASNGVKVNLDVLISSRAGARWWGGDYAVEEYNADPDASVSDRFVINVDPQGRIA